MRISRTEMLLEVAHVIAKRGTCARLSVGAVIAREGRILSTGYNGAPRGLEHCNPLRCDMSKPCTWASHAESNAITYAAFTGVSTHNATMYITDSPCETCAKSIINAGIIEVCYSRPYRVTLGIQLLESSGIICRQHDQS